MVTIRSKRTAAIDSTLVEKDTTRERRSHYQAKHKFNNFRIALKNIQFQITAKSLPSLGHRFQVDPLLKSQKHITQIPRMRHIANKAKGAIIAGVPVEVTVVIAELGG